MVSVAGLAVAALALAACSSNRATAPPAQQRRARRAVRPAAASAARWRTPRSAEFRRLEFAGSSPGSSSEAAVPASRGLQRDLRRRVGRDTSTSIPTTAPIPTRPRSQGHRHLEDRLQRSAVRPGGRRRRRYALDGYKARIAAENAKGGINGVKIDVSYKDDAFTPDRAKANATRVHPERQVDSLITFGSGPVGRDGRRPERRLRAAALPQLVGRSSTATSASTRGRCSSCQRRYPRRSTTSASSRRSSRTAPRSVSPRTRPRPARASRHAFQNAAKGTNMTIAARRPRQPTRTRPRPR